MPTMGLRTRATRPAQNNKTICAKRQDGFAKRANLCVSHQRKHPPLADMAVKTARFWTACSGICGGVDVSREDVVSATQSSVVRVSTEMFPEKERFAAFREDFVRRMLAMDVIDHSGGRPRIDFTVMSLGPITFSTSTATPIEFVREKHHVKDGKGHFSIAINDCGLHRYGHAGEERLFDAGSAGFVDNARPWRSISETSSSAWHVSIPEAKLKNLVLHPEDLSGKPVRSGPVVRLLKDYMRSFAALKEPPSPELAAIVGGHFLDLVAAALGPTAEAGEIIAGRGVKAARIRQIQMEIERRCGDSRFDLDHVARTLGLSRRYVQQLLEVTEKPFTERLLERRLERAVAMLKDRRCDQMSIAAIAFAAGFGDVSHFNRVFRRRLGDTPSGIRAAARKG